MGQLKRRAPGPPRGGTLRLSLLARRSRERGAAVFMVVLVLSLITAIGVFSMRSAGLVNLASGFNRQNVQTTALAEYAMRSLASYMDTDKDTFVRQKGAPSSNCSARYIAANPFGQCKAINDAFITQHYLGQVTLVDGFAGRLSTDGSPTVIQAELGAEVLAPSIANQSQLGGTAQGSVYSVVVRGNAKAYPSDAANPAACSPGASRALSKQSIYAHVTVNLN